jgi:hypothetical protein
MNQSRLAGAFFPVNESVWEHLKLAPWSVLTFSAVEFMALRKIAHNYFFAKAIGILIIILTILVIYYSYTAVLTTDILVLDIGSYVAGVLLCQWFCYKRYQSTPSKQLNSIGSIMLLVILSFFIVYTYNPPHLDIFKDKRTGTYGIKW